MHVVRGAAVREQPTALPFSANATMERKSGEYLRDYEDVWLRRLADGALDAREFVELEERLLADEQLRERYVLFMGLESRLYEHFSIVAPTPAPARSLSSQASFRWWAISLLTAACAVGIVASRLEWELPGVDRLIDKDASETTITELSTDEAASPTPNQPPSEIEFNELSVREQKDVAIVTEVHSASDGEPAVGWEPGMRLKPGLLTVHTGHVRLEFMSGAEVVVDGPARLELLSRDAATLISGRVAARVPPQARGFVLNAPDTAVVDLGTEFAMSVNELGQSEVYVLDGEVEVSLLDSDGSTLRSERIKSSESVRVGRNGSSLETSEKSSADFLSVLRESITPLSVSDAYVSAVRDSRPLIYWRFETSIDGQIPNEMGAGWPGRVFDELGEVESKSVVVENGMARFRASDAARYVDTGSDHPLPRLNDGSFSFEIWVNPDHLHNATVVATSPEGAKWSDAQLNVIELAHQTDYVHTPATFRFLHRFPSARARALGVNLFAPYGYTPGQWHHVVAIKTPRALRLYINGELVKQFETLSEDDDSSYRLILGQLRWTTLHRQFIGGIDEFALYKRALTAEEVLRHFHLIAKRSFEQSDK